VTTTARVVAGSVSAALLAVLAGCSSEDPRVSPDCVSPFHFDGREYRIGPGPPDVDRVRPGARLGEGASESCDQYWPGVRSGGDELTGPRPVFRFPRVPPEQAIVLRRVDGPAAVLLAWEKPAGGWDPDLRAWLGKDRR
jgi:hypothetical protein